MSTAPDFVVGDLRVRVFDTVDDLAFAAAYDVAGAVNRAVEDRGEANVMFASGLSQVAFLDALVARPDVDWTRVAGFHMDEYVGMAPDHPASFRRYMREHVVARVQPAEFHELRGDAPDVDAEIERYTKLLEAHPLDVCCLGIGENGHLAFNDPPANFDTQEPYIVVELDPRNRAQQVREGWFASFDEVPRRAITMSIRQILKARAILCLAPGRRKAQAVRMCFAGEIGPMAPASAVRLHPQAMVYLDRESARDWKESA